MNNMKGGLAMRWFNFEFDSDLHYEAKIQAAKEQISLKELIHKAVRAYLDTVKKGSK